MKEKSGLLARINGKMNQFGCLDGTTLKLIAMISMVFDHVGDIFFPEAMWMRYIGRLAMPIFLFARRLVFLRWV